MDRKTYLTRLTLAARWRLPASEAEEVISDYRELLDQRPEPDGALLRDLGDPVRAVKLLGRGRDYTRWLAVFCCLCLALALGLKWLLLLPPYFSVPSPAARVIAALLCCFALCMLWFRRPRGAPRAGLPKALLPIMGALVLAAAALGALVLSFLRTLPAAPGMGMLLSRCLTALGVLFALAALAGLLAARLGDRRWRALFLLGLTALLLCALANAALHRMDLSIVTQGGLLAYFRPLPWLGMAGLAGAGACLC